MSEQLTDHPDFRKRTMMCRKIDSITVNENGTLRVTISRDESAVNAGVSEHKIIDCKTFSNVVVCPTDKGNIDFQFEEYFTEEKRAKLHAQFLAGEYDYLGDLPEF